MPGKVLDQIRCAATAAAFNICVGLSKFPASSSTRNPRESRARVPRPPQTYRFGRGRPWQRPVIGLRRAAVFPDRRDRRGRRGELYRPAHEEIANSWGPLGVCKAKPARCGKLAQLADLARAAGLLEKVDWCAVAVVGWVFAAFVHAEPRSECCRATSQTRPVTNGRRHISKLGCGHP